MSGAAAANVDGNAETMLRGPIHEAFAEPMRPDIEPTMIVPKPAAGMKIAVRRAV